jgi:hypothetical protein
MPRPKGEPRVYTAFRCKPASRAWLDELAESNDLDLSAVLRAALAVAKSHEPELKMTLKEMKEQA